MHKHQVLYCFCADGFGLTQLISGPLPDFSKQSRFKDEAYSCMAVSWDSSKNKPLLCESVLSAAALIQWLAEGQGSFTPSRIKTDLVGKWSKYEFSPKNPVMLGMTH